MKTIFFGTPSFAVIIFNKLLEANIKPAAVVTAPDRPAGRGQKLTSPLIKVSAKQIGVPVFQPESLKSEQFLQSLRIYNADVFIVASYGKILPEALLAIPPRGTINVHPSLLPNHRGPSPMQTTILNGDKTTGVTLMLTDKKMDHGPIIMSQELKIKNYEITYTELHDKLAEIGGDLLIKTLPKWIAGEIISREQEHEKATYTKLLTKEDGHIDWSKSAIEIDRAVRALNPWPGAWSYTQNKLNKVGLQSRDRVKIIAGYPSTDFCSEKPGTFGKTKNDQLAVCARDMLYVIEMLQMEGEKPRLINASEESFLLGSALS
jgi:methionyl-tRNA formyltransferase